VASKVEENGLNSGRIESVLASHLHDTAAVTQAGTGLTIDIADFLPLMAQSASG
jgi:hypothetical protein